MMRFRSVNVATACQTANVLRALFCLAVAPLVACGVGTRPKDTPPVTTVNVAVAGQTVTKVRTAGNAVVLLEQRLTSIFEDGPQRTLALLQPDGHTVHPYMAPVGWS